MTLRLVQNTHRHFLDFLIMLQKQSEKQQTQIFEITEFLKKWPLFEQFLKYSIYWLNFYDYVIVNIGLKITP